MISIAIDGPSGAGKSTIARAAAKKLGYIYADTGALYRAIGLFAVENGIDTKNAQAIVPMLSEIKVELVHGEEGQRIFLGERDVSDDIRRPEIGMAASDVAAISGVRDFLLELQRDMAKTNNIVMDGRDIGTVILPDAQVKIFLTASAEERARRRYAEFLAKGEDVSYNEVLEDMRKRDVQDETRSVSPLRQADDAVPLDTTGFSIEESTGEILKIVSDKLTAGGIE